MKTIITDKYPPVDSADEYSIGTPGRLLSIKMKNADSYDQKAAGFSSGHDFTEMGINVIKSENENKLFTGIIKTASGEDMIRFLLLISKEEPVYLSKYAGIGNYSDIRFKAYSIIRRFSNQF